MSGSSARKDDAPGRRPRWDIPKPRQCLRCAATFQSAWFGERICGRCKSSAAWRQGVPAPTGSGGRSR